MYVEQDKYLLMIFKEQHMSNLRKEYTERKLDKQKQIEEAALSWLKENVVFVNESIDPKTINLLVNKISRFEKTFGKHKEKIPALTDKLQDAENELQAYLTGSLSDNKASELLEKLGYLYNSISTFLNQSLKVLLKTPLFKGAKENPEVKLNVLDVPGNNAAIIRDAFVNALKPSVEDALLLKKLYRGKRVPLLDAKLIASQLLNLSYHELEELTGVEKIPMVSATPEPQPTPPVPEIVAEQKELLQEVDTELLNKVKTYSKALNVLKKSPNLKLMPVLSKTIDDLEVKVNNVLSSGGSATLDKIKSMWGGDMDSQLRKLTTYLKSLSQVWDVVKEKFGIDLNNSQETLGSFDPTISPMVSKILKDKNLARDFVEQTPANIEMFSTLLNDYFAEMNKVPAQNTPAAPASAPQAAAEQPKAEQPAPAQQSTPAPAPEAQPQATAPAPAPETKAPESAPVEYDSAGLADEVALAMRLPDKSAQQLAKQFDKMKKLGYKVVKA